MKLPKMSFAAAGDMLIQRIIPTDYEGFDKVSQHISRADAKFFNLETTIHRGGYYGNQFNGGSNLRADPKYSKNLIAAYCIGWRITEDDVARYPHLNMAQGEDDTGVIVSFNCEAEGVEESLILPKGMKTLAINPPNWKTDSTPADKSLHDGACFTSYSGAVKNEIPQLTGAYIDQNRGTLRVTDIVPADYSSSLFPDGVYHLYDYQFFYRNLQNNVAVRVESFLQK